jgi:hypothetical protein
MSDSQLLVHLEKCALLGQSARSDLLAKLLPDTDEYVYLKLTDDIVNTKGELDEESLKTYQRLVGKDKVLTDFRRGIKIRKMLYELSTTTDDSKKKSICKEFNKMTANHRFTHRRPKIAEGMTTNTGDSNKLESSFTSKLSPETEDIFGPDKIVQDYNLSAIKSGYLLDRNLDDLIKTILDKNPGLLPNFLNKLPTLSPIKNLNKHLMVYIKKVPKSDYNNLFKRLTLSQLVTLGNEYKDLQDLGLPYINEMYHKSYPEHSSVNKIKDIATVKKIYSMALSTKVHAAFPGLSRLVLRVLLELLLKDNKTDSEFLEDFIKNPSSSDVIFSQKLMEKFIHDYNTYAFVSESSTSTTELVTKHLKLLYHQGQDISKYSHYFNEGYLSKLKTELQLKSGQKVNKVLEIFTKSELDFINQEKYLSFVEKQKDFKTGEKVVLKLDIKNISKVTMKVFEINTVNYCTDLQANVEDNVKLDGLVSIAEKTFTYSQPSIISHIETFELDILAEKSRGVFVIDFLGEGTTSRTIIRKGMLNVLMKKSRTGYVAKVLDDDFNVCKGDQTGIYHLGKFYPASEDGTVRFDFPSSNQACVLILRNGNFCYVVNHQLKSASTQIHATWIYHEETFLPGNKCVMLLRSNMFVAGQRVPLSNIKSTEISATFTKTNGLTSTQDAGAVTLKEDEDYAFSFYLPNGTKTINLTVNYTYQELDGSTGSYPTHHCVQLLDRDSSENKTHVFLRKETDVYVLYHLGKNGEPIPNTEFKIFLQHTWRRDHEEADLITDAQGRIHLGQLQGVSTLGVQGIDVGNEQLSTFFVLSNPQASIPTDKITSLEGETIQLPVLSQFSQEGVVFCLHKINKKAVSVVEECTEKVNKRGSDYVIEGLAPGDYIFRYAKGNINVSIKVLPKGRHLNSELIFSENKIYDTSDKSVMVSNIISDSVFNKEGADFLELCLDKFDSNTRIHILSGTFLEEGQNKQSGIDNLNSYNSVVRETEPEYSIKKPKMSYLEDRQLPGEMLYAMNRRNNELAIGTTSDKPSLFIKTQEVRDTNYRSENVNNGGDFVQNDSDDSEDDAPVNNYNAYDYDYGYGRKEQVYNKRSARGRGGYHPPAPIHSVLEVNDDYGNSVPVSTNAPTVNACYFDKIRHFLKNSSSALVNLHPDASGRVTIPLNSFSTKTLKVYVVNDVICASKTITVATESPEILKTDLTLQQPSSSAKMFAYERDVYRVMNGTQIHLPGFSSCEYELIDNVAKLIHVKTQLSGSSLPNEWNFLKDWGTMKIVQKVEKINELFSYELALFLFKKERELFNSTMKDFVKCKVNKNVLDYYLLEDSEAVASFLTATKINDLNSLEKVCIIDLLAKSHPVQCQYLLQNLQGDDSSNLYDDSMAYNFIFDRIVNLTDRKGGNLELKRKVEVNTAELSDDEDSGEERVIDSRRGSSCCSQNYNNVCIQPDLNCQLQQTELIPCEAQQQICLDDDYRGGGYQEQICLQEPYGYQEQICSPEPYGYQEQICLQEPYGGGGYQQQICEQRQTRSIPQQRNQVPRPMRMERRRPQRNRDDDDDSCERNCDDDSSDSRCDEEMSGGCEENITISSAKENFDYMIFKKNRPDPSVTRLQQDSLKTTKEYREMAYYFQPKGDAFYKIEANVFWVDLAKHLIGDRSSPFLSQNFVYVQNQHIPFVVAFTDLNQIAPTPKYETLEGETYLTLTGGHALLYLKHFKEREAVQDNSNTVLCAQKWFDKGERFEYNLETGRNEEKSVDFFLTGRVYGSQVVVTNVSSIEQKIQIITEIPQGSIPIIKNDFRQHLDLKLGQFSTHTFEFYFYFPGKGDFTYCPACVTRDGKKVAIQTASQQVVVLDEPPKKIELKSIKDILAQGSKEDILNFMRKENITNPKIFNFCDIYWLLRDEEFYREALKILKEKLIFNPVVWSYSINYGDVPTFFELMNTAPVSVIEQLGLFYFNNESQENALELQGFKFLEYHPILNARFHQLSANDNSILNQQFLDTYTHFLKYLFEKNHLVNTKDKLILVYYLLLQDRIDEAFSIYSNIPDDSAEISPLILQYDYMGAYFDLYKGMPAFKKAKAICEKYFDYPVTSWRTRFIEIANQLAEIEGETAEVKADVSTENKKNDQEILSGTLDGAEVVIQHANISSAKVELFEIDLEVLFSLYSFRTHEFDKLVFSEPHFTESIQLPLSSIQLSHKYAIPKPFNGKNVLVKVGSF